MTAPVEPDVPSDPEILRRRYEAVLASVTDGVLCLDPKGIVVTANAAGARALGYAIDELVGKSALDSFHRAHADGSAYSSDDSPMFATLSDGNVHHVRGGEVFWRKDGKSIPVEYTSTPVRNSSGKVAGLIVTFRSTSERERTERALRESEERFRRLSDGTREGVVISEAGKVIDANLAAATMFGYDPADMIGKAILDLVAPPSRELVGRHDRQNIESTYEAIGLRKDRSTFPIEVSAKSIPYQGRTVRVAAVRDLTDRRSAEEGGVEQYKRIVDLYERLPDAFFALDKDWKFVYLNPVALAMVQPQNRGRRIGEDMWATFPDLKGTKFDTEYHRAMADQVHVHVEEYFARLGRWFEADAYPTPDGMSIFFRDITKKKEAGLDTTTISRTLARKLVLDLVDTGGVPHQVLQQVGRKLASESHATELSDHITAYAEMGLGTVRVERREEGRFTFTGSDLLEKRVGSRVATCYFTLGYLSEAVSRVNHGEPTLGTEIECQSRGSPECRFVVQVKKPEEGLARRVKELV